MYIFEASLDSKNNAIKTLIIFSGQLEGDDYAYGARLEKELALHTIAPDHILFVFPKYLLNELKESLIEDSRFYRNILRYGNKTDVQIVTFDGWSKLEFQPSVFSQDAIFTDLTNIQHAIIKQGIFNLVRDRKTQIIQKSPPGTIFIKPSGELYDEFIKTSELSIGYAQNQFVAFCILSKRPRLKSIKNIWIDTSSISAFMEAVTYYMYRFSNHACKYIKYHSFKSYEKLNESKPDYVDDIWMIISASTSNNLGVKACKEWKITNEQITTILSYKDKDPEVEGDEIVANISEFSLSRGLLEKNGTAIKVKVSGENFTPHVKDPNRIIIKSIHKPNCIEKSIVPFCTQDLFSCNRCDSNGHLRNLHVNVDLLLENDIRNSLEKWLRSLVDWNIPVDTKWIVFDKKSKACNKLFEIVNSQLIKHGINLSEKTLDFDEAKTAITGEGTVIVLAPVISSARSLLILNRNLRISKHLGNRVFITPFVTSPSKVEHSSMVKTLTYGPNKRKYGFHEFHTLFIGNTAEKNSWELELSIIENFIDPFWTFRSGVLSENSRGLINQISTPAAPNKDELKFNQDYAFWDSPYDPSKVKSSAVYLTVSTILQGLRDKSFADFDTDSLAGNIYQHAVIDPENFLRFDDPLLQSCLWRSATNTEMDYSSSNEMSLAFKIFFERQIDAFANNDNNATVDIFIGIACLKIKISNDCLEKLVMTARVKLARNNALMELLSYIDNNLLNKTLRNDTESIF